MNISDTYDHLLRSELERRLKRAPTDTEIANGDFDNDLVNEILWEIVTQLDSRITNLENK